jgi:acyl-CoA-binding protein
MAAQSTTRSALAAGAAVVSMAAAWIVWNQWRHKQQQQQQKSSNKSSSSLLRRPQDDDDVAADPPLLTRLFETAARDSKHLHNKLSNGEKLVLYSLYKQSTLGDAPLDDDQRIIVPPAWKVVERAKYNSWNRIRGMTKKDAMIHYIDAVQQLQQQQPTTKSGGTLTSATTNDSMDLLLDDDMEGVEGLMGNTKPSSLANNKDDDTGEDGYPQGQELTVAQQVLRAASQNNVSTLASLLQQNPALVQFRDDDGQSALHLAADKGAVQALEFLLQAGADGNAADDDGITCLQAAVIGENIQACRILLDHGANPDQPDIDGDTPRSCAEEDGSEEMKLLFASYIHP